jgi:hypothetical protein
VDVSFVVIWGNFCRYPLLRVGWKFGLSWLYEKAWCPDHSTLFTVNNLGLLRQAGGGGEDVSAGAAREKAWAQSTYNTKND